MRRKSFIRFNTPLSRGPVVAHLFAVASFALQACASDPSANTASGGSAGSAKGGSSSSGGSTQGGNASSSGGSSQSNGGNGSGGSTSGGSNSGGSTNGGANNAGTSHGGSPSGGANNGGSNSGGSTNGGANSGGKSSGGATTGGNSSGGKASGGAASGGTSSVNPPFILGADISQTQEYAMTYKDTDGQTKSLFALLKHHGFNYVRLKTFVEPKAAYGYASTSNGCTGLSEAFGDRDHVIAYGKQAKAAGMGFLLDFHYSDNWADPGNQIIPSKWRSASNITALAALLKAYTKDVITTAIAAGARPDMVQVGNEITGGLCAHIPDSDTDCWGNNAGNANASISGSISNWNNTAALLNAGIQGVREVDSTIKIMLHVENTKEPAGIKSWVDNAQSRNVSFDILGLSCYVNYQGQPSVWESTFSQLATAYPNLKFAIAEYNPERTRANTIMKALPNGRGVGTFFWEPTKSGEWGNAMFTFSGNVATAITQDFAEYDALLPQLGLQAQ